MRYDHPVMKAVAEIQVVPIGVGVSVRAQVRRAQELICESGLLVQEHSFGTNVEGDPHIYDKAKYHAATRLSLSAR